MGEAEEAERRVGAGWLVVDIGNTHIKFAVFCCRGPTVATVRPVLWRPTEADLPSWVKGLRAAVASVNPAALPAAHEFLDLAGARPLVRLQSDGAIFRSGFVSTDVATPETTGVDRVLACLGALLEEPGQTVVVVECGTATTVNVMTPDRCFRGGMILPGRRMSARALRAGTAGLPEADPKGVNVLIGKSTQEALESGISAAFIGGIRECVREVSKSIPSPTVFLTGGDAESVQSWFPDFRRVEWLALRGLYWYATQVEGSS